MDKRDAIEVAFTTGKAHVAAMPKRVAEFFSGSGLMRMELDDVRANDLDKKKWVMCRTNFNESVGEFARLF